MSTAKWQNIAPRISLCIYSFKFVFRFSGVSLNKAWQTEFLKSYPDLNVDWKSVLSRYNYHFGNLDSIGQNAQPRDLGSSGKYIFTKNDLGICTNFLTNRILTKIQKKTRSNWLKMSKTPIFRGVSWLPWVTQFFFLMVLI